MRKVTAAFLLALLLCTVFSPCASASFPADPDPLVYDSEYFRDRGFDSASAMLEKARKKNGDSFILVFYSRYDSKCRSFIPAVRSWAEENRCTVYGIDQYNRYTAYYGYHNILTYLDGWEYFIDKSMFSFPAVFAYNGDTRVMTAKSGVTDISQLEELLNEGGMLGSAYHDRSGAETNAASLNKLGLFLGTGAGPDLYRRPTRIEALVMLIRLLGKEQTALMLDLSHPFTDVPAWADPYVGYAYNHDLTQGISSTLFGSALAAESSHYLTFVLRALGYSSDTDFAWDSPYSLAYENGLLPDGANTGEFFRSDMVMVTYASLFAELKDESDTIGSRLINMLEVSEEDFAAATGTAAVYTPISQELQTREWNSILTIDPKSPAYILPAIKTAVLYAPKVIIIPTGTGEGAKWYKYISDNLHIEQNSILSLSMTVYEDTIYIMPEYTVAQLALAGLFLDGYEYIGYEYQTVCRVRDIAAEADNSDTLFVIDAITAEINIIEDNSKAFDDADTALLLGKTTAAGLERAKWLLEMALENREYIR